MTIEIDTGSKREERPPLRSWRPTDPPCTHVSTVPIMPVHLTDGTVSTRRCLSCGAAVAA